jgi:hypothetical protein
MMSVLEDSHKDLGRNIIIHAVGMILFDWWYWASLLFLIQILVAEN